MEKEESTCPQVAFLPVTGRNVTGAILLSLPMLVLSFAII
jgi:hypothetical protein